MKSHACLVGLALGLLLAVSAALLAGQTDQTNPTSLTDSFETVEKAFDAQAKEVEAGYDAQAAAMEKEWDALEKETRESWEKMAREVEKRWGDQVLPSQKVWVDYDADYGARSRVDFETGKVKIEVLVPAGVEDPKKAGEEKIAEKFETMFHQEDPVTSQSVLQGQIQTASGQTLNEQILAEFLKDEVTPQAQVQPEPVVSEDGQNQIKVSVEVPLVPEHLRVRAERYMKDILENSGRQGIEPALVLAIIHTESAFNPLAQSSAGAYGLMQLIPRHGARDAWRYLYGKDRVIHPRYLLDPGNNIRLGAAYLFLLQNRYFQNVADPANREYVVICAYNWGPTQVQQQVLDRHPIDSMGNEQ